MKPRRSARPAARMKAFVLTRDGGRCYLCGELGAETADHVLPLALGGADTVENQRAAHKSCNATKSGRIDNRGGVGRWLRIPEAHPGSVH